MTSRPASDAVSLACSSVPELRQELLKLQPIGEKEPCFRQFQSPLHTATHRYQTRDATRKRRSTHAHCEGSPAPANDVVPRSPTLATWVRLCSCRRRYQCRPAYAQGEGGRLTPILTFRRGTCLRSSRSGDCDPVRGRQRYCRIPPPQGDSSTLSHELDDWTQGPLLESRQFQALQPTPAPSSFVIAQVAFECAPADQVCPSTR